MVTHIIICGALLGLFMQFKHQVIPALLKVHQTVKVKVILIYMGTTGMVIKR